MFKTRVYTFWLIVINLAFLILAFLLFISIENREYRNFNANLEEVSDTALAAINPERLKTLKGTSEEMLANPDYIRLKDQLIKLGDSFANRGIDSIYAMEIMDDQVIFLVDSFLPSESKYSAPGISYEQPPLEIEQVYKSGQFAVSDAYTDEYGSFLSRFSPIRSFSDQKILGVLGVDVDYHYFQNQLRRAQILGLLILALVYILFLLFWLYFKKRGQAREYIFNNESKLKGITDVITDAIVMVDEEGRVNFWNRGAVRLFGQSEEKALGQKFSDLAKLDKLYDPKLCLQVDKLNFFGRSAIVDKILEAEYGQKGKTKKYLEFSLSSLYLSEHWSAVGVFRDISQRKAREMDLLKQKEDFEQLSQAMVGRELKMLELKNELKALKAKNN
ncbi:MAG: PAS domain S-box protein [Patescibacteria group bacterium]